MINLLPNISVLSIEVIEYGRFQINMYNRFIRRQNCKRISFYCDMTALEQHERFRASCDFSQAIRYHKLRPVPATLRQRN